MTLPAQSGVKSVTISSFGSIPFVLSEASPSGLTVAAFLEHSGAVVLVVGLVCALITLTSPSLSRPSRTPRVIARADRGRHPPKERRPRAALGVRGGGGMKPYARVLDVFAVAACGLLLVVLAGYAWGLLAVLLP